MLIYIIRHGEAHNGSSTGRDRDRALTDLGHLQARAGGEYLAGLDACPKMVIASPYVRAQETAGELCEVLQQAMHTDDRLSADRGLTEMLSVVEEHSDVESIAIVSHMPTVGEFVSLLADGPAAPGASLWTGQVVVIRTDGNELIGSGEVIDRYRLES